MKLKQQILLLIGLSLIVPAILITSISVYKIKAKADADIEEFRNDELTKLKLYLKHITDIGFGMIEVRHKQLKDSLTHLPQDSASQFVFLHQGMEKCLTELSKIRFDKGEGYFWVTNNEEPYPTMIMHAEKSDLKGQVLSDAKYNVEKHEGRNIYQVRAELSNEKGDAFVEYIMKKPGSDEVANKISYSRLYRPLGWIVSTGFYTDQIEVAVNVKKEALAIQIREMVLYIVSIAVFVLTIGLVVSFYFSKQLTNAILQIKEKLKELASGRQVNEVISHRKDEVGDMTHSLNELVDGLQSYTAFAKEIGQGNLAKKFDPLSTDDVLGNELLVMRDNLQKAEHEKSLRDWANEGQALMGEVLRRNNTDTKELANEILKALVKYLKVNQGALFIIAESADGQPKWMDLMATYAYDKKKYDQKRIQIGEGLAGQCVLEKATMHLREIPEHYISITSGLGHALPRTIIIVPLIHSDNVYGVIELASFEEFQPYQIQFIEKIAEGIASTISTVQVNERTKSLLEQSQQMSEELKTQEEELRQNQEELQATQEQMRRRQVELENENEKLKKAAAASGNINGFHPEPLEQLA